MTNEVIKELEYNKKNPNDKYDSVKRKREYGYVQYGSYIYQMLKSEYEDAGYHSEIPRGAIREGVNAYKKLEKEIMCGRAIPPTFKRNQPIRVRSRVIEIKALDTVLVRLVNKIGGEKYNILKSGNSFPVNLIVKSRSNYAREAMSRFLSGRYELRDSHIQKKDNQVYLLLAYKDNNVKQKAIDKEKILGIDLGISKAVTMQVGDSPVHKFIEGGEIESFRKRTENKRVSRKNQLSYASRNRHGHGAKTLLNPVLDIGDKINNFRQLTNHRYSDYIVQFAIKNGCGTIQMEDLSGISADDSFLKNWSYFDLQNKIEYKAGEHGIETVKIKPDYTSQRCNRCGVIDKKSRVKQSLFECVVCAHRTNADLNAARNIAIKDIEGVITEQLKIQSI